MTEEKKRQPQLLQLNSLFLRGKEELLRDTLHKTIEKQFPNTPSEKIHSAVGENLKKGFNLKRYLPDIKAGKGDFCKGCLEARCCTVSDPVVLEKEDIDRLKEHGLTDFSRLVVRRDGEIITAIAKSAPCMFLKDNRCTIYKFRPRACWNYPMNRLDTGETIFLLPLDCCIAYNLMLQQIKDTLKLK
jgi:Fe-S-cluster containining protein